MPQQILVIDDDKSIRELLLAVLEDENYDVVLACDGMDALEKLHTIKPNLILLDLMMPRMNGYTFLQELKSGGMTSIPVLVFSAHESPNQTYAIPVANFIAKPFDIDHLLTMIERYANPEFHPGMLSLPQEGFLHL